MSKIRTLEIAQLMDWMMELIPVWEVPVSVAMIHRAIPDYSRPVVTHALKNLTLAEVLFGEYGSERTTVYYLPVSKRKIPDIQTLICKGRLE